MLSHSVISDWGLSLAKMCLVLGPNEAQALYVSLQENSVRDTAIGKKWVCLDL